MRIRTITWTAVAVATLWVAVAPVNAQIVEAVGERALGMGGAFVAVASDSSAVWWNPAALADGPFFDLSIGRAVDTSDAAFPARRERISGFALSTPVIGASVYRFGVVDAVTRRSIAGAAPNRQDEEAPVGLRSWSASAFGGTIVQTLVDGVHVGATVKYVRGTLRTGSAPPPTGPEGAIDQASGLAGGRGEGTVDLDLGALATAGVVRVGLVVRNVRAPQFGDGEFTLPRQARIGLAIATEQAGGPPLTISVDADLVSYTAAGEKRRVLALGAEQWFAGKRLGVRAGARFNQVGEAERVVTAGVSLAVRSGSYVEAHVVGGGSPAEQGWGTGVRVSF